MPIQFDVARERIRGIHRPTRQLLAFDGDHDDIPVEHACHELCQLMDDDRHLGVEPWVQHWLPACSVCCSDTERRGERAVAYPCPTIRALDL